MHSLRNAGNNKSESQFCVGLYTRTMMDVRFSDSSCFGTTHHCVQNMIVFCSFCPFHGFTASSMDFLLSDGEDEGSFLSLPATAISQRSSLTSDFANTNASKQQLLIQVNNKNAARSRPRLTSENHNKKTQTERLVLLSTRLS